MAPPPTRGRSLLALLGFLLVSFAAAGVGSLAQGGDVQGTYLAMDRPAWAPPPWVFGPVWTVLYVLIAVAAWRVWRTVDHVRALALWGVQLAVNAAWPGVFFGLGEPGWALLVIVVLDLLVITLVGVFSARDRLAALLLVPYLGWILFATALNAAIWLGG